MYVIEGKGWNKEKVEKITCEKHKLYWTLSDEYIHVLFNCAIVDYRSTFSLTTLV